MCKAALALDGTYKNLYSQLQGSNQEQRSVLPQVDDMAWAPPCSDARRFNTRSALPKVPGEPFSPRMRFILAQASRGPVVMPPCPGRTSAQDHRDVRGSRSDSVSGAT